MTGARIGIRVDATAAIGGGHVMRCLALTEALEAEGAEVVFLSAPESSTVAPALARWGGRLIPIAEPEQPVPDLLALAGEGGFDAIIVDHYGLEAEHEREFRRSASVILVVDDLCDRPHDCDLLVDITHGRREDAYAGLAPGARLMLGSTYALLRPAFARLRPEALARRELGGPIRRILISFGLTDPGGRTAPAVERLLQLAPEAELDVVLPSRLEGWRRIERLQHGGRVRLHDDPPEIAHLMAAADVAVGAGGVTAWERCCLGLPSLVATLADNQQDNVAALTAAGAAAPLSSNLGIGEALSRSLPALLDPAARTKMGRNAAALCDGAGAARVARALLDACSAHPRSAGSQADIEVRRVH